jgi:hypothetical protein
MYTGVFPIENILSPGDF